MHGACIISPFSTIIFLNLFCFCTPKFFSCDLTLGNGFLNADIMIIIMIMKIMMVFNGKFLTGHFKRNLDRWGTSTGGRGLMG